MGGGGGNGSGSIPACAGEPGACELGCRARRVYPRVCGGTRRAVISQGSKTGLSPRVRGNRFARRSAASCRGSIPACAGEPVTCSHWSVAPEVYPRVCGGTRSAGVIVMLARGLSPRVRGNHVKGARPGAQAGSIPACAGERLPAPRSALRVYPRVCGGTIYRCASRSTLPGLSPRVRGNLRVAVCVRVGAGSIPACAGEPVYFPETGVMVGVYPRVCGGTTWRAFSLSSSRGLSPRVRGNLAATS